MLVLSTARTVLTAPHNLRRNKSRIQDSFEIYCRTPSHVCEGSVAYTFRARVACTHLLSRPWASVAKGVSVACTHHPFPPAQTATSSQFYNRGCNSSFVLFCLGKYARIPFFCTIQLHDKKLFGYTSEFPHEIWPSE